MGRETHEADVLHPQNESKNLTRLSGGVNETAVKMLPSRFTAALQQTVLTPVGIKYFQKKNLKKSKILTPSGEEEAEGL